MSDTQHSENKSEIKGLVACEMGVGVSIFANKFLGIYFGTYDSMEDAHNCRSINNLNIISIGGIHTTPERRQEDTRRLARYAPLAQRARGTHGNWRAFNLLQL